MRKWNKNKPRRPKGNASCEEVWNIYIYIRIKIWNFADRENGNDRRGWKYERK